MAQEPAPIGVPLDCFGNVLRPMPPHTVPCKACGGTGKVMDYSVPGRTHSACDGCHGSGVHRI